MDLSIYVTVYNHEKYIARALDSILMQKTRYTMEVLVGEDASTDGTRAILQEYEQKYPGKFTMFYREKNMNDGPCSNSLDLRRRCRGKYLICLEGDDFWTDPDKLEKQITFLEEHPEYIAVAHNCVVVGEDSEPNGETYPECKDHEYTFRHFFQRIMPGQTATVLCRNYMILDGFDRSLIEQELTPGDQINYFSMLCYGKIYCMQEIMSAYRHITNHGTSYSATYTFDYEKERAWYGALADFAEKHCSREVIQNANYMQASVVYSAWRYHQLTLPGTIKAFWALHNRAACIRIGIQHALQKVLSKK